MTNREDQAVYDAQANAFEDTPLGDSFSRTSLIREVVEITNRLNHLTGDIAVEDSSRLVKYAAYARGQKIVFSATDMSRYVAVHEVAHVVHRRSGLGGRAHGPEYRAIYAEMIDIVYGPNYGRLLREAFQQHAMGIHPAVLPHLMEPIIDLEVLSDATRNVRWL